jgi:hypothetical protein
MRRLPMKLVSILAVLFLADTVQAHEGHAHLIMGTVTAIDTEQVTVQSTDGKTVSILLDADTKYRRGDGAATQSDLKVGKRVVIEATGDEHLTAQTIRLGASSTESTK